MSNIIARFDASPTINRRHAARTFASLGPLLMLVLAASSAYGSEPKTIADNVFLGGALTSDEFAAWQGLHTVVDFRTVEEKGVKEEKAALEARGIRYISLPISGVPSEEIVGQVAALLDNKDARPMYLHCASGNRVADVWARYQIRNGMSHDTAIAEATRLGLREDRVAALREYHVNAPAQATAAPQPGSQRTGNAP